MSVDRSDLHALLDRVPESDLPVTRKLLQALAAGWTLRPSNPKESWRSKPNATWKPRKRSLTPAVRVSPTKAFSKNSIWPDALFHLGTRGSRRTSGNSALAGSANLARTYPRPSL